MLQARQLKSVAGCCHYILLTSQLFLSLLFWSISEKELLLSISFRFPTMQALIIFPFQITNIKSGSQDVRLLLKHDGPLSKLRAWKSGDERTSNSFETSIDELRGSKVFGRVISVIFSSVKFQGVH